jgi:hypothetical protein
MPKNGICKKAKTYLIINNILNLCNFYLKNSYSNHPYLALMHLFLERLPLKTVFFIQKKEVLPYLNTFAAC